MAVDEALAERVRKAIGASPDVVEKRMFGGVGFLVRGNMSVGVHGDELVVRIDPAETERALGERGVRLFDITGRPMKGWLLVSQSVLARSNQLARWVKRGIAFAGSLPAKTKE